MFKTEAHAHVSETSACSFLSASEMVSLYHKAGFSTLFISDHLFPHSYRKLTATPWEEKMDIFAKGFEKAKEEGEKVGMNVLLSAEIAFNDVPNHYLIYGDVLNFFKAHPNICDMGVKKFFEATRPYDIFVVQAHPFRNGICFPTSEFADAFEIYNSNPHHEDYNDKAKAIAEESGLPFSAGSDTHQTEDAALCGILSKNEIKTSEDFISLIKSGKAEIYTNNRTDT